jgi:hypothetical protein
MTDREPRLNIYRGLTDSEPNWLAQIAGRLRSDSNFEDNAIDRVIRVSAVPRVPIITHGEVTRLLDALGIIPDISRLDEIRDAITERLPETYLEGTVLAIKAEGDAKKLVNVLPLGDIEPRSKNRSSARSLRLGKCAFANSERGIAKEVMHDLFEIDNFPKGVWLPDAHVTGLPIARSASHKQLAVLHAAELLCYKDFVPESIGLEPLTLEVTK